MKALKIFIDHSNKFMTTDTKQLDEIQLTWPQYMNLGNKKII